ncbi:GNAT family N-acetyltransferase [Candidatus Woesearchaeota archaeon]|nr:GNAT family N-acetyltransferase [Candidatus Woesearchaeota archaeon]
MVVLKGKRIDLVTPTMKHCDDVVRHIGVKAVNKWLVNVPYPYRKKEYLQFMESMVKKKQKVKTDYLFFIREKERGEIIGGVGIHKVDRAHNNAEIGYWVAKPYWRKGYAYEAARLALKYCFKILKLNKIYLKIYDGNKASAALAKKLGFTEEGVLRKHRKFGGKYADELRYGMLRSEFAKKN